VRHERRDLGDREHEDEVEEQLERSYAFLCRVGLTRFHGRH
jgi:hypothetical protein